MAAKLRKWGFKMNLKGPKEKSVQISLRIDPELLAKIQREAKKAGYTTAQKAIVELLTREFQ